MSPTGHQSASSGTLPIADCAVRQPDLPAPGWRRWRTLACFHGEGEVVHALLVLPASEVEGDGEGLPPADDELLAARLGRPVLLIVALALQVARLQLQICKARRDLSPFAKATSNAAPLPSRGTQPTPGQEPPGESRPPWWQQLKSADGAFLPLWLDHWPLRQEGSQQKRQAGGQGGWNGGEAVGGVESGSGGVCWTLSPPWAASPPPQIPSTDH